MRGEGGRGGGGSVGITLRELSRKCGAGDRRASRGFFGKRREGD